MVDPTDEAFTGTRETNDCGAAPTKEAFGGGGGDGVERRPDGGGAAAVEPVPTTGGGQGRAGGGQRLKEVFLPLRAGSGRGKPVREEMRWGGGDGEADPREGKKKLDENVVLVSFFLGVENIE
jgi:hypothetical protein